MPKENLRMKVRNESEFRMSNSAQNGSSKNVKMKQTSNNNNIKVNQEKSDNQKGKEINKIDRTKINKEMSNTKDSLKDKSNFNKKKTPIIVLCLIVIIAYLILNNSQAKEGIEDVSGNDSLKIESIRNNEDVEHLEVYNTYISEDYIIEDSNERFLEKSELSQYTKIELAYIRNEIFARKGYIFNTQKYKDFFESKDWYIPNSNIRGDFSDLNIYEETNVKLIKELENK